MPAFAFLAICGLAYLLWNPGKDVTDGRHDRGQNGIYLQHGWLADDAWFKRNRKLDRQAFFRDRRNIRELAEQLRRHHITDVFPHLCPAELDGSIAPADDEQVERFLDEFAGFRVLPWIGGSRDSTARPELAKWRAKFTASAASLLAKHPRLAGVHVNIEPCADGSDDLILLLGELRAPCPRASCFRLQPTRRRPDGSPARRCIGDRHTTPESLPARTRWS